MTLKLRLTAIKDGFLCLQTAGGSYIWLKPHQ